MIRNNDNKFSSTIVAANGCFVQTFFSYWKPQNNRNHCSLWQFFSLSPPISKLLQTCPFCFLVKFISMPFQGAVVKGLPLRQHQTALCHILTISKSIAINEKLILYGKYNMNWYTAQHVYTLIQYKHKGKVNIFKDFWDEMWQLQIYSPPSLSGNLFHAL